MNYGHVEPDDGVDTARLRPVVIAALVADSVWAEVPVDMWQNIERRLPSKRENVVRLPERSWRSRRRLAGALAAAAVLVPTALAGVFGYSWSQTRNPAPQPDVLFALNGTELQPLASGVGEWRKTPSGMEIVLDVTGLPPLPDNGYYQGWLKGDKGTVTIGTFHARRGGDDIVLWSGVEDIKGYDTLTITRQEEGGGAASSGDIVLFGVIDPA